MSSRAPSGRVWLAPQASGAPSSVARISAPVRASAYLRCAQRDRAACQFQHRAGVGLPQQRRAFGQRQQVRRPAARQALRQVARHGPCLARSRRVWRCEWSARGSCQRLRHRAAIGGARRRSRSSAGLNSTSSPGRSRNGVSLSGRNRRSPVCPICRQPVGVPTENTINWRIATTSAPRAHAGSGRSGAGYPSFPAIAPDRAGRAQSRWSAPAPGRAERGNGVVHGLPGQLGRLCQLRAVIAAEHHRHAPQPPPPGKGASYQSRLASKLSSRTRKVVMVQAPDRTAGTPRRARSRIPRPRASFHAPKPHERPAQRDSRAHPAGRRN